LFSAGNANIFRVVSLGFVIPFILGITALIFVDQDSKEPKPERKYVHYSYLNIRNKVSFP
jgi:hypothetical protein